MPQCHTVRVVLCFCHSLIWPVQSAVLKLYAVNICMQNRRMVEELYFDMWPLSFLTSIFWSSMFEPLIKMTRFKVFYAQLFTFFFCVKLCEYEYLIRCVHRFPCVRNAQSKWKIPRIIRAQGKSLLFDFVLTLIITHTEEVSIQRA